jgi:hypothetical protein
MLRALTLLFLGAVVVEAALMAAGVLGLGPGAIAISLGLFFAGVMHGLWRIGRELEAVRRYLEPAEPPAADPAGRLAPDENAPGQEPHFLSMGRPHSQWSRLVSRDWRR